MCHTWLPCAPHVAVRHLVTAFRHDFFDQEGLALHSGFVRASVVYAYLMPEVTSQLEPLLRHAVDDGKVDSPLSPLGHVSGDGMTVGASFGASRSSSSTARPAVTYGEPPIAQQGT